jgi:uncharacterized protein YlzI (FlbEa/FlbD family)
MFVDEKLKRVGKFVIDYQTIDNDPDTALLMLSGKLIVRAEACHEMRAIEYHAYCDDFDEVEQPGRKVPEYIAEFNQHEFAEDNPDGSPGGTVKVMNVFKRWVKV